MVKTMILKEKTQAKLNVAVKNAIAQGYETWKAQYTEEKAGKMLFFQKMVEKGGKPVGF